MKKLILAIMFTASINHSFIFAGNCFSYINPCESEYNKAWRREQNKLIRMCKLVQQKNLETIENFIKNRIKKKKIYDLDLLFCGLLGELKLSNTIITNRLSNVFINQIAQLLLNYKIKINIKNIFYSEDWLYKLAESGDLNVIIFIIKNCSDIDFSKFSILKFIRRLRMDRVSNLSEITDVLKLLINSGVDINEQHPNTFSNSALIHSIQCGDPRIFPLLLNEGANTNLQDDRGMTALMHAIDRNKPEVVYLLLIHDADVTIKDNNGKTFDDYAYESKKPNNMSKLKLNNIIKRVEQDKIVKRVIDRITELEINSLIKQVNSEEKVEIDKTIFIKNESNQNMPDELIERKYDF